VQTAIITAKLDCTLKSRVKHTQPYNSAVHTCKNGLHECLFEYKQSSPKVCAWKRPDRNNKEVKYTPPWNSAGHNCRNKAKQAAALRECLVDYKLEPCSGVLHGAD